MTAEQSVIERSPFGVSEHPMTGSWRVIVARKPEKVRTWYYHAGDHARHIAAINAAANAWFAV